MEELPVKVYIYDLSKGLARSMSQAFLGKQINGIWHTSIVVYGQEFYYGGMGLEGCQPGGTVLGQPDSIKDLGNTQIPFEMFMDYLQELANTTFRNECYHLLNHNCNTFSDEVAQFLTGNPIPSHITNLPQEVLDTPFGAMIKPFIDSMSVSPDGGSQLFSAQPTPAPPPATPRLQDPSASSHKPAASSQSEATKSDKPNNITKLASVIHEAPQTSFNVSINSANLEARDKEILCEVDEYLNTPDCSWSLGRSHIDCLCKNLTSETNHNLVSNLFLNVIRKEDIVQVIRMDANQTLIRIAHKINTLSDSQQQAYCKLLCNLCSYPSGTEYVTSTGEWKYADIVMTNKMLLTKACVHCVLSDNTDVRAAGNSLALNISLSESQADTVIEVGSALIQQLADKTLGDLGKDSAFWSLGALCMYMELSEEVGALANVMGLDVAKFMNGDQRVNDQCNEIMRKMHSL